MAQDFQVEHLDGAKFRYLNTCHINFLNYFFRFLNSASINGVSRPKETAYD